MSAPAWIRARRERRKAEHKIGPFARAKLLVFQLVYGHLGGLAAVGGYYVITQVLHGQHADVLGWSVALPDVKGTWDHLLDSSVANGGLVSVLSHHDWNTWRHLVRPLYEGIFGGLLFALVSVNPYKLARKKKDSPPRLSRTLHALRIFPSKYYPITAWQVVLLPLTVTLASIPGVLVGFGVDRLLRLILHVRSLAPAVSAHPSFLEKFYSGAFDAKIIGLFGSAIFAVRAARPVFAFILDYFAVRRAAAGKKARIWHPPAFKFRVEDFAKLPPQELLSRTGEHALAIRLVVPVSAVLVVGFAATGYYVLTYIAKG